ncbi:hypothetical protein QCA50_010762 [Cerrena zonata]|uniref:NmrA-like domain-containing protein n=1 Tax=Cerrena zonata TaxID=2478898 RepID=A0AAW0G360_9APHY
MDRKILVIGATGRQGKALIRSLQPTRNVPSNFQILALSRNLASPSAAALKAFPNVQLVKGDLNRPETVRKIFDEKTRNMEEQQGMMLANFALEYEVVHFVYSSVERGGESDDDDPSMVGRIAKVRIERYIKSLGRKGLNWTTVRPVLFMEDIKSVFGRTSLAVLRCVMKPDVKMEIVGVVVFLYPALWADFFWKRTNH